MFNKYFVILLVSVYTLAPCEAVCDQYILLLKHYTQSDILKPMKLNDIDWSSANCPINSPNTLSCSEIYANRSCVIEIEYESSERTCVEDIKLTNYSIDEYETMTPTKFYTTEYYPEWSDTTESSNMNNPMCDIGDTQCEDNHKNIDNINLIYVTENTTHTKNIFNNINNSLEDLNYVLRCSYTDICSNNDNVFANNHTANTILAILSQNTDKEQFSNFNCSYINDTNNLYEQYITLTYNILMKHNCEANFVKFNNNMRYVNVYFKKDYIYNNSADINCVNNFKSINNITLNIKCNKKLNNESTKDIEVDRTVVKVGENGPGDKNNKKNTRLSKIIQEPLVDTSNKHKTPYQKKTNNDNILVYIIAGMLTIAVLSIITIFVIRTYKPVKYRLTSTREWPQMENSAF